MNITPWRQVGNHVKAETLRQTNLFANHWQLGPTWPKFFNLEDFDQFMTNQDAYIASFSSGVACGGFGLRDDTQSGETAWVYYYIFTAWQGRQLSSQLIAKVVEKATLSGYHKIVAKTHAKNNRSQKALAHEGFSLAYLEDENHFVYQKSINQLRE